ncbi:MAG: prephenate dehydrogenase/arogenate dehydrogenase family protein [Candidatus Sumerlaeota bacterium]|nr:prephenate dehydrogenase/arogenate dehydrogenase family protein [Candidatus Sumerlaeota bacterium]
MFSQIAIYGVGLLGGSLGLACRARRLAGEVIGVGRNEARLQEAQKRGAIDRFTTDAQEGFQQADLIVLCAPVHTIIEILPVVRSAAHAGVLVTDVGSSKETISRAAAECFKDSGIAFVGSHPMTGSDRTGVVNARESLYEGAPCFLTPTDGVAADAIARLKTFWGKLGMVVTVLPPAEHDALVAYISHLPHAAAVAVMMALQGSGLGADQIRALTGPGLLDTTRVAAGSTDMWRDIFLENRSSVLAALSRLSATLDDLRQAIESKDVPRLERILNQARALRQSLDKK